MDNGNENDDIESNPRTGNNIIEEEQAIANTENQAPQTPRIFADKVNNHINAFMLAPLDHLEDIIARALTEKELNTLICQLFNNNTARQIGQKLRHYNLSQILIENVQLLIRITASKSNDPLHSWLVNHDLICALIRILDIKDIALYLLKWICWGKSNARNKY